jgi:uncharacterized membrane protein YvlD (DUF360 family)
MRRKSIFLPLSILTLGIFEGLKDALILRVCIGGTNKKSPA